MSQKSLRSSLGINPKTSFYFSNGTGRDSYIMHDNGGTVKGRPASGFPQPGRFIRTNEAPRMYKPFSDHKVIHYNSDGSGRDNYILVNSGGLMNKTYTVNERFKNMLREPDQRVCDNANAEKIERMRLFNPELNFQQRIQSAKMSRPKRVSLPFNYYVQNAVAVASKQRQANTISMPQLPKVTGTSISMN